MFFTVGIMVGILLIVSGVVIKQIAFSEQNTGKAGLSFDSLLQSLTSTTIILGAFSEVPAVIGIVFYILTGKTGQFYMMLVLSLFLYLIFYPNIINWKSAGSINREYADSQS